MKLTQQQIESGLAGLPGWSHAGNCIHRTFRARSFPHAIALVTIAASFAEVADHHPDITIRYDAVTFELSTHSAGGVTEKDFALARKMEEAFGGLTVG
jgi:4a-hydroxytetrahydrobiopterin dehydratase